MRRGMCAYNTVSLSVGPIPFLSHSLSICLSLALSISPTPSLSTRCPVGFFYNPRARTVVTETAVNFVPPPLPKKHIRKRPVSRLNTTNLIATVNEKIPKDHNKPVKSSR